MIEIIEYLSTLPEWFQMLITGVVSFSVCTILLFTVLTVISNIFKSGIVIGSIKIGRRRPKSYTVGKKKK